jgi:hypothetical protein
MQDAMALGEERLIFAFIKNGVVRIESLHHYRAAVWEAAWKARGCPDVLEVFRTRVTTRK